MTHAPMSHTIKAKKVTVTYILNLAAMFFMFTSVATTGGSRLSRIFLGA